MSQPAKPIAILCETCRGDDVSRDAWGDWNTAAQTWVLRTVFDHIIAKRWETLPPVSEDYLGHVKVLVLPLAECVAKINAAGPDDEPTQAPLCPQAHVQA